MKTLLVASMITLTFVGVAQAAGTPAQKCAAAKMKAAAKYAACRLKADAKAESTETIADYTKCNDAQAAAWQKIESKDGAACPTSGDQTDIEGDVSDVTTCLSGDLGGGPGTCTVSTTLLSCPPTGVILNGVCWVLGDLGASCTAACQASGGLLYDEQTRTYAGSAATTLAHCLFLLDELGVPGSYSNVSGAGPTAAGCATSGSIRYWSNATTTDQVFFPGIKRVCACH